MREGRPASVADPLATHGTARSHGTPGDRFLWAVGIEDTFIPQLRSRTGRSLDEYELTGHYRRWRDDLALAAEAGVLAMRYGIPWYRVNPAPGAFDWAWTDAVLEHVVRDLRILPIVDLMHYGCPMWLEREFVHPDYPDRVAEYAHAFVERYRDLVSWYTPLNEPRITARMCGLNGTWPPYLRGERGYVRLMLAVARGMSLTAAAIRSLQPSATLVQVEAAEQLVTADPSLGEVLFVQREQQFLATDLLIGRVDESHALHAWLLARGAHSDDLEWLVANRQTVDVMGVNFYPEFTRKTLVRAGDRVRRVRGGGRGADLRLLLDTWQGRYARPVMVTETSTARPTRRLAWLSESIDAVRAARAGGTSVIGYTWWPLFSLVAWSYRGGAKPASEYLVDMGLWDLRDDGAGGLRPVRTPVADRFAEAVAQGDEVVGEVAARAEASPAA